MLPSFIEENSYGSVFEDFTAINKIKQGNWRKNGKTQYFDKFVAPIFISVLTKIRIECCLGQHFSKLVRKRY